MHHHLFLKIILFFAKFNFLQPFDYHIDFLGLIVMFFDNILLLYTHILWQKLCS